MTPAALPSGGATCGALMPPETCDLATGHTGCHQTANGMLGWPNYADPDLSAAQLACPHGSVSAADCGLCEDVGLWPPQEPSGGAEGWRPIETAPTPSADQAESVDVEALARETAEKLTDHQPSYRREPQVYEIILAALRRVQPQPSGGAEGPTRECHHCNEQPPSTPCWWCGQPGTAEPTP
jgi:hypothetical protein